jgi:hypothetical protein
MGLPFLHLKIGWFTYLTISRGRVKNAAMGNFQHSEGCDAKITTASTKAMSVGTSSRPPESRLAGCLFEVG